MPATYTMPPVTVVDKVRTLIGDTDTTNAVLLDEEIQWLVDEEVALHGDGVWIVYMVASAALSAIRSKFVTSTGGIEEKVVGRLKVKRQSGEDLYQAFDERMRYFRQRGILLMTPRSRAFKAL